MNYYAARELKNADGSGTGKWHYTCENDGACWPVGKCSSWDGCPDCDALSHGHVKNEKGEWVKCKTCDGKGIIKKATPCPGHATPEEACEHYKEYLLDGMKILGPKKEEWPKDKCDVEGCNKEATHLAMFPGHMLMDHQVCAEHATREVISKLVGGIGEIWSS